MKDTVLDFLSSRKLKYACRTNTSKLSSIRVGGTVEILVEPHSAEEYLDVLRFLYLERVSHIVLGGLSNTLVATDLYEGVVVSTRALRRIEVSESEVYAECGVSLASLMSVAARCGLGGAEQLWLIPGTVGGAVRGNSGAHGLCIADVIKHADVFFAENGSVERLSGAELEFSYRSSLLKHTGGAYLLSATLSLNQCELMDILARRRKYLAMRQASQPIDKPSLGSVFKRCNGISAGYYIELAGLKGARFGGASISEKHAGFIVNDGNADWRDVVALVEYAERCVYSKLGIMLEREIEILR